MTGNRRPLLLAVLVAVLAALFAAIVLGRGYLFGTGPYWQNTLYDAGTHLGGWLFYKEDAWRFPVFETVRMGYPDGTSVILTDSLPLIAILAKAIGLGALGNLNYFSLFVFGSYVLNSLALLWLLRQLGVSNLLGAFFAFVFACFTTLYCIQFESFFAHFLVIFSLGFYFREIKRFSLKEMWIFGGMVLAALLIHPYLFAMCLAIMLATILKLWISKTVDHRQLGAWTIGFVLVLVAETIVSGYFLHPSTGIRDVLYGLAPDFALDPTDLFKKNYVVKEIGVYFGWGFWLLVVAGLWAVRGRVRLILKNHIFLVIAMICLLLLAVSNTLFWSGQEILHINLPSAVSSIFEMFRASKRLIVPVYYLTAAVAMVLIIRKKSVYLMMVALAALLIQIGDNSYFVKGLYASSRTGQTSFLDREKWKGELSGVKIMQTFPSYSCLFNYRATPIDNRQFGVDQEFYEIVAKEHIISNSIRAARRTKDCDLEAFQASANPPAGSLYIYIKDNNKQLILKPSESCLNEIQEFEYGAYCKGK